VLMRVLTELQIPLPRALHAAAEITLNRNLRQALANGRFDRDEITGILNRAKGEGVTLDFAALEFIFRRNLETRAEIVASNPASLPDLQELDRTTGLLGDLPFTVNLWQVQNVYYRMLQTIYPSMQAEAHRGREDAKAWVDCFVGIGKKISVRVP
jgi:hypothetical protein